MHLPVTFGDRNGVQLLLLCPDIQDFRLVKHCSLLRFMMGCHYDVIGFHNEALLIITGRGRTLYQKVHDVFQA